MHVTSWDTIIELFLSFLYALILSFSYFPIHPMPFDDLILPIHIRGGCWMTDGLYGQMDRHS